MWLAVTGAAGFGAVAVLWPLLRDLGPFVLAGAGLTAAGAALTAQAAALLVTGTSPTGIGLSCVSGLLALAVAGRLLKARAARRARSEEDN